MALSHPITKREKERAELLFQQPLAQMPPALTERCLWIPLPNDLIARIIGKPFACIFHVSDLPFISEVSFKNLAKAVTNTDANKEKRAARAALPLIVIEHTDIECIITLSSTSFATVSCTEIQLWKIDKENNSLKIELVKKIPLFRTGKIRSLTTHQGDNYLCGLHQLPNALCFWIVNLQTGMLTIKNCPRFVADGSQLISLFDTELALVGGEHIAAIPQHFLHIQLRMIDEELVIHIEERALSDIKIKHLALTPDKQFWITVDTKNNLILWLPPKGKELAEKLFEHQLHFKNKIKILPSGHVIILNNDNLFLFNPYRANEGLISLLSDVTDLRVMHSGKLLVYKKDGHVLEVEIHAVTHHFTNTQNQLVRLLQPKLPAELVLLIFAYNSTMSQVIPIPSFLPEPLQFRMMRLFYHAATCSDAKDATRYLCDGLESKTDTPAAWVKNTSRLFEGKCGALTKPLKEVLGAISGFKP